MPDHDSSVVTLGNKSSDMGVVKRTDEDITDKNLSEIEEEVATADDFVIYGRASVEVFDRDTISQKIEMEAFEESLDQFFAQGGPISYQHKDVQVGYALEEYELSSDVSIQIGDETKEFSAGDTLETKVEGDTLWLVAHIYGRDEKAGSDASVMTRLGAYEGELDGFSVTIKNKEYQNTPDGQVISEIDFHSVTVGTGEQIKNPDSLFGVAEFKLGDYLDTITIDTNNMALNILEKLRQSSTEALGEETISHALRETYDLHESAKAMTSEEDVDTIEAKAVERLNEIQEKAEDRDDLVAMLTDMTDLSSDEVNKALDEMLDDEDEEDEMEDKGEHDYEDDEMDEEEKMDDVEAHAEAIADMMDMSTEEVMDALMSDDDDEDDEMEDKAEESEEAEESVETESKSDEDESPSEDVESTEKSLTESDVESIVEDKLGEVVEEKLDQMEAQVAESVSERVSQKLKSGETPEQDNNPADDGTRNLLNEW